LKRWQATARASTASASNGGFASSERGRTGAKDQGADQSHRANLERNASTGGTALRLAHFFGTSAQFWLNLQSLYDLRIAQEKVGKSIKALPKLKRREVVHG
jgi:hypothetical protein